MKNGLVIADSGPIISLAIIDQLQILYQLFDEIKIPQAVWEEISINDSKKEHNKIITFFHDKIKPIKYFNDLTFILDPGESESVILYKELNADFLLIDDKKARIIAENFGVKCIGTIGILSRAKSIGLIENLRPLFLEFLQNKRFYSIELLNSILILNGEQKIH